MKLFRISLNKKDLNCSMDAVNTTQSTIITIGNFDGVHLGHQVIMQELKKWGIFYHMPTLVLSFHPTPKTFFLKEKAPFRLMRLREKYDKLKTLNIDQLCLCRFDKVIANLSAEDFVTRILRIKLRVKHIVIGEDFKFGKNRQGDATQLQNLGKQYGFGVSIVPILTMEGEKISSTRIRSALSKKDEEMAKKLLGSEGEI